MVKLDSYRPVGRRRCQLVSLFCRQIMYHKPNLRLDFRENGPQMGRREENEDFRRHSIIYEDYKKIK
ncbi:hypothetical protein QQF64_019137 [Cirrhinus molitorella]|uniref:Uncharacterized protein n=1 Tax=Cirrhinus molitorella TaxID=172907 RepID=A0ABR3LGZ7_9TELE